MNMLKMKWLGLAALVLGAVACEPLPVYPQTDGPYRPHPERPYAPRDAPAPYGGDNQASRDLLPDYDTRPENDPRYGEEQPPVEQVPPREQYPMAQRTDKPNRVLSPYAPYNVIDIEGFRSGQLAKDPSNGKIFRVP